MMSADSITYLQSNPGVFATFAALFGLLIGSFLNVVIYRLPLILQSSWRNQCNEFLGSEDSQPQPRFNLIVPRSSCPHCGHMIGALENIPVISYLLQKGRCKHCSGPISARYPIIETITAVMTAMVAWHFGFGWQAATSILLTWSLICLTVIDLDHQLLPDNITLPFLWLGLFLSLSVVFVDSQASIIGALAGYLVLWTIFHLFRLLTGKEGMGYGDFKLLAMLGAWLGWQALPVIILLSSVVGAVVGISLILLRGHDRSIPIPFGPYLAAAGWLALMWGEELTQTYLNWATPV